MPCGWSAPRNTIRCGYFSSWDSRCCRSNGSYSCWWPARSKSCPAGGSATWASWFRRACRSGWCTPTSCSNTSSVSTASGRRWTGAFWPPYCAPRRKPGRASPRSCTTGWGRCSRRPRCRCRPSRAKSARRNSAKSSTTRPT